MKAHLRQQQHFGIASSTLTHHLSGKRVLEPETACDRPTLVPEQRRLVMNAAASADRGNRGMARKQLAREVQDFVDLAPKQACDDLDRTLLEEGRKLGVSTGVALAN